MAELAIWFKLWVAALDDVHLDNLDMADFGRWAKFGAFVKSQGTLGTVHLEAPCRSLCAKLQVEDWDALLAALGRLPGVEISTVSRGGIGAQVGALMRATQGEIPAVSPVTVATVTFRNWLRYQGDYSTDRVRKYRSNVTAKKRLDESREDETLRQPGIFGTGEAPRGPQPTEQFFAAWSERFEKAVGEKPVLNRGKTGAIAARLLKQAPIETLSTMMDVFFADTYARSQNFAITFFAADLSRWQKATADWRYGLNPSQIAAKDKSVRPGWRNFQDYLDNPTKARM